MAEQEKVKKNPISVEYIVVSDKDGVIVTSTEDREQAKKMAKIIRKAGGEVTIFRSLTL
jgi:hypothetical protein